MTQHVTGSRRAYHRTPETERSRHVAAHILIDGFDFLNAVFASAEIAVISMSDLKLRQLCEAGDRRAGKLEALIKQPAKFLATIQVAITLAGFLQSAFAAENFCTAVGDAF